MKFGWRIFSRCCRILTSVRALIVLFASWRKLSLKWWVIKVGWFLMLVNRMVRRVNCWM